MNLIKRRNRRGASTVEFALTVPILLMFLFATYEIGRANMMFHTCEAAAYEGARVGIVPGGNVQDCIEAAEAVLSTAGITNATVNVDPSNLETDTETLTVEVSFRYQDNTTMFPFFMSENAAATKSCTLTRER